MITKNYYIEDTILAANEIAILEAKIPCFTDIEMLGDGYLSFTITCRAEDVCIVERYLAAIV